MEGITIKERTFTEWNNINNIDLPRKNFFAFELFGQSIRTPPVNPARIDCKNTTSKYILRKKTEEMKKEKTEVKCHFEVLIYSSMHQYAQT